MSQFIIKPSESDLTFSFDHVLHNLHFLCEKSFVHFAFKTRRPITNTNAVNMTSQEFPNMPAGPVLELHGQTKRFHVPQGLTALMEEMAREVLKNQPSDIYEFLADYLDNKISGGTSKSQKSIPQGLVANPEEALYQAEEEAGEYLMGDEGEYEDNEELGEEVMPGEQVEESRSTSLSKEVFDNYGLTMSKANFHATKIQAFFRGFQERNSFDDKTKAKIHEIRASFEGERPPGGFHFEHHDDDEEEEGEGEEGYISDMYENEEADEFLIEETEDEGDEGAVVQKTESRKSNQAEALEEEQEEEEMQQSEEVQQFGDEEEDTTDIEEEQELEESEVVTEKTDEEEEYEADEED